MKLVYVSGPISAPTHEGREENIERGRRAGAAIWRLGAVALVPHLNSLGMFEREKIPVSDIYLGDLVMLERCDAVLLLPGWENSRGCAYEVAWANYKQIPIFFNLDALKDWL